VDRAEEDNAMDFRVVTDSLVKIVTDIVSFIPRLINGLIILLIGYLVARLVRWLIRTILSRLRVDPLVERTGITGSLRGLGVRAPFSEIVAQTIFALLLLSFLITATQLMGLTAVALLLQRLLNYLPNAIAALIVFLLGGIVAQFTGNLVTNVAASAGIVYAGALGRALQYLISLFVVVLALGTLGIDTTLLVTALTILIAAAGLALSLALGLGARGVVGQILAGYYLRQRLPVGRPIVLDQVRGEVSSVGSVNTLIATAEETIVVPNSLLFESLVRVAPAPPDTPAPPRQ
jgi:small-conductance mechanosensitive channel